MAMVMMVVFCVPVMATESQAIPDESGVKELQIPEMRFPSQVGIDTVRIYPANLNTGTYYTNAYSSNFSNYGQICNVTINSATRNLYNSNGCNGWFIEVDARVSGANRYERKVNGVTQNSGSIGWNSATFYFPVSDFTTSMDWEIILYDNTTQGKPIWGHIYK